MEHIDSERMQCMEVWGGNQAAERSFQTPGLKIWIYSQPYREAVGGGDVYYLTSCASGRITRMLLADVSGHGEIASQVALDLRDLMRRNVNFVKQTRFVRAMNQQFADFAEQDVFATALVSTFFAPTQSFALCNAGHPVPLVFRQAASEWSELVNVVERQTEGLADMPLGIVEDGIYQQFHSRLQTGDMVLSYSDAVSESQDAHGRLLGEQGVLRVLRELPVTDPGEFIPALVAKIRSLSASNLQQDDATLLLCQSVGGGPSLMNNLLAPFRLLGTVADRTQLT